MNGEPFERLVGSPVDLAAADVTAAVEMHAAARNPVAACLSLSAAVGTLHCSPVPWLASRRKVYSAPCAPVHQATCHGTLRPAYRTCQQATAGLVVMAVTVRGRCRAMAQEQGPLVLGLHQKLLLLRTEDCQQSWLRICSGQLLLPKVHFPNTSAEAIVR